MAKHEKLSQSEIVVRKARTQDSDVLLTLLKNIDDESNYLLFEPGERQSNPTAQKIIVEKLENPLNGALYIAWKDGAPVGYAGATRRPQRRVAHVANFSLGVLQSHQGRGAGQALLEALENWASSNMVRRIELTVVKNNESAIHIYKKRGYLIEGVRRQSFLMESEFIDELYMAKILNTVVQQNNES